MREKRPEESRGLSKKLKQLRKVKGWSQGQLASKMGVHVKQISKYEREVSFPTVDVLIKLSKAFGVSLDDLVFDDKRINAEDISNPDLIEMFYQVNELDTESQQALLTIMDALIVRKRVKSLKEL